MQMLFPFEELGVELVVLIEGNKIIRQMTGSFEFQGVDVRMKWSDRRVISSTHHNGYQVVLENVKELFSSLQLCFYILSGAAGL